MNMVPTHQRLIRPTKLTSRAIELLYLLFLTSKFSTSNLDIFPSTQISFLLYRIPLLSFSFPLTKEKIYSLLSTFTHFTAYPRSPSPLNLLLILNFQTPIPLSRPGSFYTSQFYQSPFSPFSFSLYKTQISISVPFIGLGFGFFFSLKLPWKRPLLQQIRTDLRRFVTVLVAFSDAVVVVSVAVTRIPE